MWSYLSAAAENDLFVVTMQENTGTQGLVRVCVWLSLCGPPFTRSIVVVGGLRGQGLGSDA